MPSRVKPKPILHVAVTDAHGRPVRAAGLAASLRRALPALRGAVTIALVSDAAMRRLNRTYRHKDYATDVLSFATENPSRRRVQGDVVIALGVTARQARAMGHTEAIELRILALHGLLHLLGYDHETDQGEMRRTEDRLRRRAGLPAGLIARTPGRVAH